MASDDLKKGIWPKSAPLWAAAIYVFLTLIRPWERMFPWLSDIYFERLYAVGMLAIVFFSSKKTFSISLQTISVLLFSLAATMSALFAFNRTAAWQDYYELMTMVMFFLVLVSVMRTPYEIVFIIISYIAAMTMYLGKAQWEFFVYGDHQYDMGVVRLAGIENTLGGPNALAMSIAASMPLLLFLWITKDNVTARWTPRKGKLYRMGLRACWLLSISSIFLTNSRSGMLTLILFVILVSFRGRGFLSKFKYLLIGMVALLILWQFLPMEQKNRFQTIWDPKAGPAEATISATGRIEGFYAGMKMFDRFPMTGIGIGNFIPYRVLHVDGVPLNAHNLAGQVLGETGILGGATFLFMIVVILINCRKTMSLAKSNPNDTVKTLARLAQACRDSIILLLFTGIFGHNMVRFNWFWLAAFSVLARKFVWQNIQVARQEQKIKSRSESLEYA